MVGKVAELDNEAVGRRGVGKADGVAVHVAHHADGRVGRNGSASHFTAA
jgi:hypothetical protein